MFPYLYANDSSKEIVSVYSENKESSFTDCAEVNGKYYPNNQASFAIAFGDGMYKNTIQVTVTDGTLKLGLKCESITADAGWWSCWDNLFERLPA